MPSFQKYHPHCLLVPAHDQLPNTGEIRVCRVGLCLRDGTKMLQPLNVVMSITFAYQFVRLSLGYTYRNRCYSLLGRDDVRDYLNIEFQLIT